MPPYADDGGLLLRRHRICAAVCSAALCGFAWPACTEPVELGDERLKETVAGKTVDLDTPFGVAIPITFHGNGLMSGKAGVLEYFLGAQVDRGRWWVANGQLCQKWFKWLDAQPSCMRLKQDGNKILWRRDDGLSGTATIASGLPPGAESPPRGVGGPRPATELTHSLVAAVPAAEEAPAKASPPPTPRRLTRRPAARASAAGLGSAPRPPAVAAVAEPWPPADRARSAPLKEPAKPGVAERWCHVVGADQASADAAPELVRIARIAYGGGELASPPNACLAAEPPLQNLARAGIDAR
jgi:hypothetical protein